MEDQPINTQTPPEPTGTPETPETGKKITARTGAIIALIVALVILGAWYFMSAQNDGGQTNNGSAANADEVVATVNGEELTRGSYEQLVTQTMNFSAQQGMNVQSPGAQEQIEAQAMDALISETLLLQAANEAGVTADEAEVASQMEQNQAQFPDEATFQSSLAAEGFTLETFREQVANQMTIQKYLEENIDFESIEVTDAEAEEFYNEIAAGSEDVPPLEEISEQVKASLAQQKEQQLVATLIEELRTDSEVNILL